MTHASPLSFPPVSPDGYPVLASEPEFDPGKHLALEMPETVISLEELGYSAEEIAECPTSLGITSCFRVLSDEGAACLQEVTRGLEQGSWVVRDGVGRLRGSEARVNVTGA